eukprot:scaffold192203_cov26-Tisochrysis_lutea.AAC.2
MRRGNGVLFRNGREAMLTRPGWCDVTSDVDFTQVSERSWAEKAHRLRELLCDGRSLSKDEMACPTWMHILRAPPLIIPASSCRCRRD